MDDTKLEAILKLIVDHIENINKLYRDLDGYALGAMLCASNEIFKASYLAILYSSKIEKKDGEIVSVNKEGGIDD